MELFALLLAILSGRWILCPMIKKGAIFNENSSEPQP